MAAATVTLHKEIQGGPRRHSEKYWELLAQRIGKVAKEHKLEEHIYPLMWLQSLWTLFLDIFVSTHASHSRMDSIFPNPILTSSEGMALEKTAQWQNQSDFSSIQQHVWHPHLKSKWYLANNILDKFPKICTKTPMNPLPFHFTFTPKQKSKYKQQLLLITKYFWPSLLPILPILYFAKCPFSQFPFTHAIYAIVHPRCPRDHSVHSWTPLGKQRGSAEGRRLRIWRVKYLQTPRGNHDGSGEGTEKVGIFTCTYYMAVMDGYFSL